MATQYGNFGQSNSNKRKKSLAAQAQSASPYAPQKIQTGVSTGNAKKASTKKAATGWTMPGVMTDQQFNNQQLKKATNSIQQQAASRAAAAAQTQDTSTPFDALASLLGGGSSASSVDTSQYDNQYANTQQAGNNADAKLQAMYAQLAKSYQDDQGNVAAQYAATRNNQAAAADNATSAINTAYSSSNSDLAKTLQGLGIQDALKVAANNGTTLQNDQAATLSGVQANKAANLAATDANSAAAQDYNRQIGDAATLEGATQRAANQQQLQKALSQIAAARTSAVNSATSAAAPSFSDALALAKAQADYQNTQSSNKAKSKATKAAAKAEADKESRQTYLDAQAQTQRILSAQAQFVKQGDDAQTALAKARKLYGG